MEAFIEIEAARLEDWRREIASMRLKALRQSVAITAGISTMALYVVFSHFPSELVLMLAALAFLVVAHGFAQSRTLRFLERDIRSHLLATWAERPTFGQLPTAAAHHWRDS
ncbi:hypothetical protein ACFWZU_03710 [Frateuria sp. GZRR33]|uniref:Uncharacterized protein n=1 Tax=Demequina muriae TaxID=3051664 RepID=A0ABT8GKA9_9MICO|nr:hypothetical protein [Demequina sp. EGI L300058]MDN4481871.1 hypothetical protein [Demequina sp. EGI L300058]